MTNKVNTTSKDIFLTELEKFKQIFPQFVQENQINFDALKEFLDKNELKKDKEDSYQFSWAGKKEAFKAIQRPSNATLNPNKNESINFDNTSNLFIEGDNLEVLKLLQQQYFNKIKMIYIDPPYNTGKDFIYKDNFSENKNDYFERIGATKDGITLETNADSNGRFHSHWLSMMYPRLFLAKQLLTDDGVIIVHIDEHEEYHLKILMNEVFGEGNFLGNIIWDKQNPKGDANSIGYQHENIMLFAKNSEYLFSVSDLRKEKPNADQILKKAEALFKKISKTGLDKVNSEFKEWIKCQPFSSGERMYSKIDENGNVYRGVSMAWPNKKKAPSQYFIPLTHPITKKECPVPERGWRNPPETMTDLLKNNLILFGEDENKQPERKYLLKENLVENIPSIIGYAGSDDALFKKWNLEFDNPKPYKFVKDFIKPFISSNDYVLDFFAGSATTGHAVMDLNKADNGSRKFILVQIPEATDEKSEAFKAGYKNIAQISKERLRIAITKNEYNEGFKVFELSPSNYNTPPVYNGDDENEVLKNEQYILDNPLIENYTAENLLYEIILKQGLSLHSTITLQDDFYIAYDAEREQKLYLTLTSKIIDENIDNLNLTPDDILVCFDTALNDTQKVNLNRNVNLLVI
jgi:adenine-specific DNA-methyltransferase